MNRDTFQPAYLWRRLRQLAFERRHPDAPWLTQSAVMLLDAWLKPNDRGLEWGSGRSTLWFASRVSHVLSIEGVAAWHARVNAQLRLLSLSAQVDYRLIPCELGEVDEPAVHPYVDAALEIADESLDFALVDGHLRGPCMRAIIPKIKRGGLLVLDNANRYLPNRYLGTNTTVHEPRSQPRTALWRDISEQLADWRWILTSDGIWDTRFWVRPF